MKGVPSSSPKCEQKTRSGNQCRANSVNGSTLCFAHDPTLAAKRTAARRRGGQHGQRAVLASDSPTIALASGGELVAFVIQMINHVLRGELDPKVANSVSCLFSLLIRVLDVQILEPRLAAFEAARNTTRGIVCAHLDCAEHFGHLEKHHE